MDYNYSNNNFNNYPNQQGMIYKKKLDTKGLVLTIMCLIMSIITLGSVFMPLIATDNSGNVDIIDICRSIGGLSEFHFEDSNAVTIITYILLIVSALLPILLAVLSVSFVIVYIVQLATQRFVKKASGFAKTVLTIETIFSLLSHMLASYVVLELEMINIYTYSTTTFFMGFGWYIAVISAMIILLVEYICNIKSMIKNSSEKSKDITTAIFGILSIIVSLVIYIAFAMQQFSISESEDAWRIDISSSYFFYSCLRQISLTIMGYDSAYMLFYLAMLFIILINIFAKIGISKNLKITKKKKFSAVYNIVAGFITLILAIANYVIFSDDIEIVKFGAAMYIYIILGIIQIILGIVYLCIKLTWNNSPAMDMNMQYQNQMQQNNAQRL